MQVKRSSSLRDPSASPREEKEMRDCPLSRGKESVQGLNRFVSTHFIIYYYYSLDHKVWVVSGRMIVVLTDTGNNEHTTQRREETQSDLNSVLNLKSQNLPGELHENAVWEKGNKQKICFVKNLLRTPEAGMKAHNCDSTHEAEAGELLQTQGKPGLHSNILFPKSKAR